MKNKSRTSLVLMELVITILLFSISSAVCVKLFVQAHLITNNTEELNHSMEIAQSIAEIFRGTSGNIEEIKAIFPKAVGNDKSYLQIYFDNEFNETADSQDSMYVCNISLNNTDKIATIEIKIIRLKDYFEIYSVKTGKFIQD